MNFEYTINLDLGRYRFDTADSIEAFVLMPYESQPCRIIIWDGHFPREERPKLFADVEALFPNAVLSSIRSAAYTIPDGLTDTQKVWLKLAATPDDR